MTKLHGVTQFSAFRTTAPQCQQRREALNSFPFFEALQNYVDIDDVEFGPNPPDFVITAKGLKIGAEVTRLNPRIFGRGGCTQMRDFRSWKEERISGPPEDRKICWG